MKVTVTQKSVVNGMIVDKSVTIDSGDTTFIADDKDLSDHGRELLAIAWESMNPLHEGK